MTFLGQKSSLCFLALVIDNLEQGLVVLVLSLIHAFSGSQFLIFHLPVQEVCVLHIDALYFTGKADFLRLMDLLVLLPHDRLLVVKCPLAALSDLLLVHLLVKILAHVCLACMYQLDPLLVFEPHAHFSLDFIFVDVIILSHLPLILLRNDCRSHAVHELLSAALAHLKLILAVSLLLVEHCCMVCLSFNILYAFALLI